MSGQQQPDLDEIKRLLAERAEEFAEHVLGPPNRALSNRNELRWGDKGRRIVFLHGSKRGEFFDYGSWTGGSLIDAAMSGRSCSAGGAIKCAKAFLGLAGGAVPKPSEAMLRDRERRRARQREQEARDVERRITWARSFAADAEPVAGTLAERYLIETRHIPKPASGWPDCVRYHARSRSLLVVSTTRGGEVRAVQLVYLGQDARKLLQSELAARDLPLRGKQTFGPVPGSVVRLPGASDGPLLAGEGPETCLSAWAATGHETWITLSRLLPADELPTGRGLAWLADDDSENSPRDAALRRAVAGWTRAGLSVAAVTPWPKRFYDKSDFNDLIRESGPEAVRARLDSVLNPKAPPPPTRYSLDDARQKVGQATDDFIREAAGWDAGIAEAEGKTPPVRAVGVDTGVGKSHEARDRVISFVKTLRRSGDKRSVFIGVPTHVLATEQAGKMMDGTAAAASDAGLRVEVWRGQGADDPSDPGHRMCRELDLMREAQSLRLDTAKSACAVCPFGPRPGRPATCGYLQQKAKRADVWLGAHNLVFEQKPEAIGKLAAIVLDESPVLAALSGTEDPPVGLSLDSMRRRTDSAGSPLLTDRLIYLRGRALEILDGMLDGPLLREVFEDAGFTDGMAKEAAVLEWSTRIEPAIRPGMPREDYKRAIRAAEPNRDLGRRAAFWKSLAHLLSPTGPTASGWAALETTHSDKGACRDVVLKGRRDIRKGWIAPTLVLDATLRPELLRHIWPSLEVSADVRVETPHQNVLQVSDRSFSLSRLDADGAKDDQERTHRERNLRRVHASIGALARRYAPGKVLVVAQLRVEAALKALGMLPSNVELAHHNGVRGIDRWRDARAVIVIGRTLPPPNATARASEALTGVAIEGAGYERCTAYREMADGSTATVEAWHSPDPVAEAMRWTACEGELVQIIGRVRGVRRTEDDPVDVWLLTDVPLPLPVHELLTAADLDPSPAAMMLAAGGIAFANPRHAAAAYPELWPSWQAAKKAIQRGTQTDQRGTNPYKSTSIRECPPLVGTRGVSFQRKLERAKPAQAWFDPDLIPDIEARLTEKLGPLAWCRVEEPTEPPDPPRRPSREEVDARITELMGSAAAFSPDTDFDADWDPFPITDEIPVEAGEEARPWRNRPWGDDAAESDAALPPSALYLGGYGAGQAYLISAPPTGPP